MTLKDYLVFFRWKNILMILLIQFLFKYVLFEKFDIQVTLDHFHFALLAVSTACLGIAGYVINDINDVKADIINKPEKLFVDKKLTRISAQNLFIGFNSLGLLIGMYLSYYVGHTSYFIIYVLTSLLLYEYAKHLKTKMIIGNLIVAFIVFFCILMSGVFDLAPATSHYNLQNQKPALTIVLIMGIFGFVLTLLREIVKDMEDIEGDKAIQARSFAIVLGIRTSKLILLVLTLVFLTSTAGFIYFVFGTHRNAAVYLATAVCLPLIYTVLLIYNASGKKDFHRISNILKLTMLLGMLSVIFI